MRMKTLVFMVGLLALCGLEAKAENGVFLSSYSATSNYRANLCTGKRGFLNSVCIVDGVASSTAAVYNQASTTIYSSYTITGVIDTSETGKGCYTFNVAASSGLYVDQFGTAGVTILYECY